MFQYKTPTHTYTLDTDNPKVAIAAIVRKFKFRTKQLYQTDKLLLEALTALQKSNGTGALVRSKRGMEYTFCGTLINTGSVVPMQVVLPRLVDAETAASFLEQIMAQHLKSNGVTTTAEDAKLTLPQLLKL